MYKSISFFSLTPLIVILALFGCSNHKEVETFGQGDSLLLGNIQKMPLLNLDDYIYDLGFTSLDKNLPIDIHCDKINIDTQFIYILDKNKSMLFILKKNGQIVKSLSSVLTFDFWKGRLFTYNFRSGLMKIFSADGRFIGKDNLGFRGIEFMCLNDSTYVFSTGGITTLDPKSEKYHLSFLKRNGEFVGNAIPIDADFQGIAYTSENRFSRDGGVQYIAPLGNVVYKINDDRVIRHLSFNFGTYTIDRGFFETIKDLEDYGPFPYVFNLTNNFNTPLFSFFSFSFKGIEGYIFYDKVYKKVIKQGLGNLASINSFFLDSTPFTFNSKYYCLISADQLINSRNLKKRYKLNISVPETITSDRPILMHYKLKESFRNLE